MKLQKIPLEEGDDDFKHGQNTAGEEFVSPTLKVANIFFWPNANHLSFYEMKVSNAKKNEAINAHF